MIIRLTCMDNDYIDLLERFMTKISINWLYDIDKHLTELIKDIGDLNSIGEDATEKQKEVAKLSEKREQINTEVKDIMGNNSLTKGEQRYISDRLTEILAEWLEDNIEEDELSCYNKEETKTYIMGRLKISYLKALEDRWENNEVVYWLQHSNKVIVQ